MIEQKLAAFAAKLRGESVECVEIVVVAETCQIIEQRAGGLVDLRSALFEQGGAGGKLGTALGSRLNLRDFLLCAVGNFLPAELRLLFSLSQNRGVCFFGLMDLDCHVGDLNDNEKGNDEGEQRVNLNEGDGNHAL